MFIANTRSGYTQDGEQRARGDFLIVSTDPTRKIEIGGEVCTHCGSHRAPETEGDGKRAACNRHPKYQEFVHEYIVMHRTLPPRTDPADWSSVVADPRGVWPHEWVPRTANALLACVRSVRMRQYGHFMMGSVVVGSRRLTLSGTYGADGLPYHFPIPEGSTVEEITAHNDGVPSDVRGHWHPVPDALAVKFWNGGGHNSAGEEGPAMRKWAAENLRLLRGKRKKTT